MIGLIADGANMTMAASGDGFTLISEAGVFVEQLLKDISKDAPHPKEMQKMLSEMFCKILSDRMEDESNA